MNMNRDEMSEETRKLYDELITKEDVSKLLKEFESAETWIEAHGIFYDMHENREALGMPPILARNRASLGILCSPTPLPDCLKELTIAYTEDETAYGEGIGGDGRGYIAICADIYPENKSDEPCIMEMDRVFEKEDVTIGDVKNLTSYIIGLRAQGYWLKEECDEVLYRPLLDSIINSYDKPFPELPMDEMAVPEVTEKYLKLVNVLESRDGSELFDKKDSNFKEAGYWSGIFGAGPLGGN